MDVSKMSSKQDEILIISDDLTVRESINLIELKEKLSKSNLTIGDLLNDLKETLPSVNSQDGKLYLEYNKDSQFYPLKKEDSLSAFSEYSPFYLKIKRYETRIIAPTLSILRKGNKRFNRIQGGPAKKSCTEKISKIVGLDPAQKSVIVKLLSLAVLVVLVIVTMTQWSNSYSQSIIISLTNQTEELPRTYSNSVALDDVIISGPTLTISNKDTLSLTKNSSVKIGQGMYFKVADTGADVLKFYVCKEITEPEAHEISGQVATGTSDFTWSADNFAGFTYDLKKNVSTESLKVSCLNGEKVIPKNGLTYTTTIKTVDYDADDFNGLYPVLGFFGEPYVPLKPNDASKLAKLILDSNVKYTLVSGQTLDLGHGYNLTVKKVDVEGQRVWLEFTKDGQYVDDNIVSTDTVSNSVWTCKLDQIQGEDGTPVLKVHVKRIYRNKTHRMAQINGIWLIDFKNSFTLKSGDMLNE